MPLQRVGGGGGEGGSLFQPVLGGYLVKNDIDETRVGLPIKCRTLDSSRHQTFLKAYPLPGTVHGPGSGDSVKGKVGKPPRMVLIPDS